MQTKVLDETKNDNPFLDCHFGSNVGMTRFELATPRPPDVCATGLRYIPQLIIFANLIANVIITKSS